MKRVCWLLLVAWLLVVVAPLALSSSALAANAVVLACLRSGGETFTVQAVSPNPALGGAITVSSDCAAALAALVTAGFNINNVTRYFEGTKNGALYTLVQP